MVIMKSLLGYRIPFAGAARGSSNKHVVNPTLNSLETGLLTVDSKLPF
jgi:hypothetical protein